MFQRVIIKCAKRLSDQSRLIFLRPASRLHTALTPPPLLLSLRITPTTTSIINMDRMDYHHHHLGNVAAVASRLYQPEEEDDSSIENTKPSSSNSKGGSLTPGTNTGRWSNEEHQRVSLLFNVSRIRYSLSLSHDTDTMYCILFPVLLLACCCSSWKV